MLYAYPLTLTPDDDGTMLVTAPDLPELTSFGTDRADALRHAVGAAVAVLSERVDRGEDIPVPSATGPDTPTVALPTLIAAKLALYSEMRRQHLTQAALADRLAVDPRQVRRLLDLTTSSRMEAVEHALRAVGKELVVVVRDAV